MKIWKKLQNPSALVAQGFLVGGLIFLATHDDPLDGAAARAAAPPSVSAPISVQPMT